MNILLLIDKLDAGGAETHVLTLARSLLRRGHRVSVLSDGGLLEEMGKNAGIAFFHPPAPISGKSFALGLPKNLLFLRRLQKQCRFDILHAHTRRTACLLRLFSVTRRVFSSRFLSVPAPYDQKPYPYRATSLRQLGFPALIVTSHARFSPRHRRLSYWGEATITVSDDLRRHLCEVFGLRREHIKVIPNGIDTDHFCPTAAPAPRDELHIVFASRLDADCSAAARAILSLLERWSTAAAKQGLRLRVTLAGGGSEYGPLMRRADEINAAAGEECVRMTGALADLAPLLQSADVFIGVSRAALEALGCGCSVILAGDEGFGGFLTPQNFDRMAAGNFCCRDAAPICEREFNAAFLSVLGMSATARKEQNAALRARLCEDFSAESMVKSTEQVYQKALRRKRKLNLLIGGYAGCGNLGDDAILRRLIERWQDKSAPISLSPSDRPYCPWHEEEVPPRLTVTATVAHPESNPFEGIECVPRNQLLSLWRAMKRADAFVLGGGCLLQNCSAHGNRSLFYYLSLVCMARLRGCPVYLVANGAGPLHGRFARWMVARILKRTNAISVRDERSFDLLQELGLSGQRLCLEPDPVLSVRPAERAAVTEQIAAYVPQEGQAAFLCVVPRRCDEQCHSELSWALRLLWEKERIYPLFFAFDARLDVPVCRRLIKECGIGCLLPTEDEHMLSAVFEQAHTVISQRLHGLILASVAKVPAVAVSYCESDEKLSVFAASAGQRILGVGALAEEIFDAVVERERKED